VHATADARFALACLLALTGIVAVARLGEAHFRSTREETARTMHEGGRAASPTPTSRASGTASTSTGEGARLRDHGQLDPNRASPAELALLPGVGPRLAAEIVATRARLGGFRALGDLRRVRGIGEKTLQKLTPFLQLDSEGLEHAADAQRDLGGVHGTGALEVEGAAHVEPERPGARHEVVGAEHEVGAGTHAHAP